VNITPKLTIVPFLHGKLAVTQHIRALLNSGHFDCIAVDVPEIITHDLGKGIEDLPYISIVVAKNKNSQTFIAPIDPCNVVIETIRQGIQLHIPHYCIGYPDLHATKSLPLLPDENAINHIGFDAYMSLCLRLIHEHQISQPVSDENAALDARYLAHRLHGLERSYKNILAIVHCKSYAETIRIFLKETSYNAAFPETEQYDIARYFVNPDHLYFVCGELPYITGKYEAERYNPFSAAITMDAAMKSLFTETRDNYSETKESSFELSPARIQAGLTFLRNLTVADDRLVPSLFDIVTAAKGIGGNSFALGILKNAKYYPFLPFELDAPIISIGPEKLLLETDKEAEPYVNIFQDQEFFWRQIPLRAEPSRGSKEKYRFSWNNSGICSHLPEDHRIETFNDHVRKKAQTILCEDRAKTEKFSSSVKDGIDIRETMRHLISQDIYVKELPPASGNVDMIVIVFDNDHDYNYPHRTTWYAEHNNESTLAFYATDPFADLIGPGISRSFYGGLSLLFPPRPTPDIFSVPLPKTITTCAQVLAYGALLFSQEKTIPYVSSKKPGIVLTRLAQSFKKRFLWIPLVSFSQETIRRLRKFHVLNGKDVRSFASRFIGDN
jgi:hypothetical protein